MAVVLATTSLGSPDAARAQLFGMRSLGRPLNSRARSETAAQDGSVSSVVLGTTALERAAIVGGDFVGRELGERSTFVGRAEGQISPAFSAASQELRRSRAQEIVRRRSQNANLLQIQRGNGGDGPVYPARLAVGFEHLSAVSPQVTRRLETSVMQVFAAQGWPQIRVLANQGKVLLEGVVPSRSDRQLAEAIVMLEPGVMAIDNQMQVLPP
jgi:hypothetical protein